MMATEQNQASDSPEEGGLRVIRNKAKSRSWLCPGAGFALMGRPVPAVMTFLICVFTIVLACTTALWPSKGALWLFFVVLLIATVSWIGEILIVGKLIPRRASPAFLVGGFPFAVVVMLLATVIVLVVILSSFGSLRLAGTGMTPTIGQGELVLYHKQVKEDRLQRGIVIVYRSSNRSAWGEPGAIIISRIMAVPGDRLSIQTSRYFINEEPGPVVAPTGQFVPVIDVPQAPETIQVPENCFFIVQDSAQGSFDSRVLSWVQRSDVVSTELYYLGGHGILTSVK